MNLITPIILIIVSIGTFFMYTDKIYRGDNLGANERNVLSLLEEHKSYQEALTNSTAIRMKRDSLVDRQKSFKKEDLDKLEKLLPDNIDNIRLIIDINQIAENRGLTLKNIKFDTNTKTDSSKLGQDNNKYGTLGLSFAVTASYDNFQNFLADLEKSLRLVDITELSITGSDTGAYDFSVNLKTYWLK